jgi:hypothetical protein
MLLVLLAKISVNGFWGGVRLELMAAENLAVGGQFSMADANTTMSRERITTVQFVAISYAMVVGFDVASGGQTTPGIVATGSPHEGACRGRSKSKISALAAKSEDRRRSCAKESRSLLCGGEPRKTRFAARFT